MPATTPCLWFDTQAEEAAEFYVSLFPNSEITGVSRYPDGHPQAGGAMTVEFSLDGRAYTGLNGGPHFTFSEAISFQISCADQAEVDHYWFGLIADGGEESQCGWLKDRFGLSWQVVPTRLMELLTQSDEGRASRAMQEMLTQRRIIVADIEAAADAQPS